MMMISILMTTSNFQDK